MNRRQFLLGSSAAAISVAVAPAVAVPSVDVPIGQFVRNQNLYQELIEVTRKAFGPRLYMRFHMTNLEIDAAYRRVNFDVGSIYRVDPADWLPEHLTDRPPDPLPDLRPAMDSENDSLPDE